MTTEKEIPWNLVNVTPAAISAIHKRHAWKHI